MLNIYRQKIDNPGAWTSRSLGDRTSLELRLGDAQLDAVDGLLAKTRHLNPQEVKRADFSHPALDPFLADVLRELQHGRGAVIITGITPERFAEDDFERIYYGFCMHWGWGILQTTRGGRIAHVKHDPSSKHGHQRNAELFPHTDVQDIVGLMCVRNALHGGLSQLASMMAIHNEILATRPELLEPLYRGHPYSLPYQLDPEHVTPYRIPVLSNVDGHISGLFNQNFIADAAKRMHTKLPDDLAEAMKVFTETAVRKDIMLEFTLQPGEILMFNNFTMIHARTRFDDTPERRRHLMRIWLRSEESRPVPVEYRRFHDFILYARLAYDLKQELDGHAPAEAAAY